MPTYCQYTGRAAVTFVTYNSRRLARFGSVRRGSTGSLLGSASFLGLLRGRLLCLLNAGLLGGRSLGGGLLTRTSARFH